MSAGAVTEGRSGPTHSGTVHSGTTERWVAMMGGTALGLAGLRRGSWALAALGGGLFLAGAAGVPIAEPVARRVREGDFGLGDLGDVAERLPGVAGLLPAAQREPTTTQANVTVAAPPDKLFRHWRNFRNLTELFPHLDAVEVLSDTESRWKAHGPGGVEVVWHSALDKVRENELITWHTLEGAQLPHRGSVMFKPAPGDRGTEVRLTLVYQPPAGAGGRAVSRLFGSAPEQQAREALRRLKRIMEAGELPTIEGQPRGNRGMREVME
ncbi:SRPBCC family protein [Azospirillum rugosum]|uniref:Membrane protein n=1 Tax=Azospirillum rugosum TaxID=416170 RepID=A0ABS4SQP7_9PROT|nr:SRPBCC family protein [Azospirillum rugosum]MBP2294884.1 putative membrane protein [Azospirillum rugosum]MDQ0528194.1 putative membrane protein [Azospirillum rugosum]